MEKSLSKLLNGIEEERQVPREWDQILTRSLHKKGHKEDTGNQLGIFPTNTISKIYEGVKLIKMNIALITCLKCSVQHVKTDLSKST